MPDMIETYAGPVAWWEGKSPTMKARTILNQNLSGAEMLVAAGLDWTVSKRPLTFTNPDHDLTVLPDWQATVRDEDNSYLGIVSPTYSVVQNETLAEIADALKGEGADYHTAGSLFSGKVVWLQAVLERDIFIAGDPSKFAAYLLVTSGHDGRHPVTFANTPTRVVCANTMAAGLSGATAKISLRHTSHVHGRLDEVRKALGMANKYLDRFEEVSNQLCRIPMSFTELGAFTEKLLPIDPAVEHGYRTEAQRREIAALFDHSSTLKGVPFSYYRAFQAVAEWADHFQPIRETKKGAAADRRALSIIEGSAFDLKTAALKLLVPSAR